MSDQLQLRIVTPGGVAVDESVREVTAPGTVGELGVLPNHVTFLTSLEIGVLSYKGERDTVRVALRGGFAEVRDNVMTVLTEAAEFPGQIDSAAAEGELRDTRARLEQLTFLDDAYELAVQERRWAETRSELAAGR